MEYFRDKVKAVRVGVQPHVRLSDQYGIVADPQVHVGHAKTFVIADLIRQELDLPLWVRFKWAPGTLGDQIRGDQCVGDSQARVERYVRTLLLAKDQLAEMLAFLGIDVDRFYLPPTAGEMARGWGERIKAIAERIAPPVTSWPPDAQAEWYDAAVGNYPTLMVRGADWTAPLGAAGTLQYVAVEDGVFEAAGHEKFVVHLPLIMRGPKKMATSWLNTVSWRVLMPMGWDGARDFLTEGVDLDNLPGESAEWDWGKWSKACQRAGAELAPAGGNRGVADVATILTGMVRRGDDGGSRAGGLPIRADGEGSGLPAPDATDSQVP